MRCTLEFSVTGSSHESVVSAAKETLVSYTLGDETVAVDSANMEMHVVQDENLADTFHATVFVRINS